MAGCHFPEGRPDRSLQSCAVQGGGIMVVQATNVTITNNLLAPANEHTPAVAEISVDVIAGTTLISDNIFTNLTRNASALPIAAGKHQTVM